MHFIFVFYRMMSLQPNRKCKLEPLEMVQSKSILFLFLIIIINALFNDFLQFQNIQKQFYGSFW